jgi:GrpB-like predicted nucleotidyltransferase (UPF0157 family)
LPDPVLVVAYDPEWPIVYQRLRLHVLGILGGLVVALEHVGSTSVPGLAAKPIIDLDAVIAPYSEMKEAIMRLEASGYEYLGDLGVAGREAFLAPPSMPPHHLYLCSPGGRELSRHILFRDYLRGHPDTCREYAALKRDLGERYRNDRDAYTQAKSSFIERVLVQARNEARD